MEKSRDSVTAANLRSAYAEAQTAMATGENHGNATVEGGKVTVANVAIKGQKAKWAGEVNKELPFGDLIESDEILDGTKKAGTADVVFTYTDGKLTNVEGENFNAAKKTADNGSADNNK